MRSWKDILRDIDEGMSGTPGGTLDWYISDLSIGSLAVETVSSPRSTDRANSSGQVVGASIAGFRRLETEGETPEYLSEAGIKHASNLLTLIGTQGVTGIEVTNHTDRIALTARAAVNVRLLLPVRYVSTGSIEGNIEMISVHGKTPRFIIYQNRTRKAVTVNFSLRELDQIKTYLGRKVIVYGRVQYNAKNEPLRVEVESFRLIRERAELPTIAEIRGIDPHYTGDLSTAQFLRSVNGE